MALTVGERKKRHKLKHPEKYTYETRKAETTPVKRANYHLKNTYGKTLQEKIDQRKKQGGICTVCYKPLPEDISKCHWDHNHTTGQLRDILHSYCNLSVGFVETELHKQALAYLEKHSDNK